MAVERGGVELGEDVDLGDAGVDAVAHGHVDEAIGASNGHSRLGTVLGEGVETGACPAAEDHGQDGAALRAGAGAGVGGALGSGHLCADPWLGPAGRDVVMIHGEECLHMHRQQAGRAITPA